MDITVIEKEIQSPALKNIARDLAQLNVDFKANKIDEEEYKRRLVNLKTMVQVVALDWTFRKKANAGGQRLLSTQ